MDGNSYFQYLTPGEEMRQTARKFLRLGTRGVSKDGREFRYAKAGSTALNVGRVVTSATQMSDMESGATAARLATQITTYATSARFLRVSATWAGETTSPGGGTGYEKNVFKDGFVYVVAGSTGGVTKGGGQMIQIKASTTGTYGTASQCVDLYFEDDQWLQSPLDTQCTIVVKRNPYDGVIAYAPVADGTAFPPTVGVTTRDITANYYFWLQTKGPCPVLISGTPVIGEDVVPSTDTTSTGCIGPSTGTGTGAVRRKLGTVLDVQASVLYSLIDLDL